MTLLELIQMGFSAFNYEYLNLKFCVFIVPHNTSIKVYKFHHKVWWTTNYFPMTSDEFVINCDEKKIIKLLIKSNFFDYTNSKDKNYLLFKFNAATNLKLI